MADNAKPIGTGLAADSEAPGHINATGDSGRSGSREPPRRDTGGSKIGPGLLLGHTWIVDEFLGRGGMGEVWRCRHIELGTDHAIKIIRPELADEPNFVALFKEEARRLSRLRSDAIVRYEGLLRDEWGRQYLVMEFVDGPSLGSVLKESRLSLHESRQLLDRVALGLAAAHDRGILHRDISPDNIILPGGRIEGAKIIDFGIAKSLDPGDITLIGTKFAGKHAFVSPEQAGLFGGHVDARSDIYCLGLVLAAAALGFGQHLNMGSSPASIIEARLSVPDLHNIPPGLRSLLNWMLQPDPSRRPQSIRALVTRDPGERADNETPYVGSHVQPDRGSSGQPTAAPVAGKSSRAEAAADRPNARHAHRLAGREMLARFRRISNVIAEHLRASSGIVSRWLRVGGALGVVTVATLALYSFYRHTIGADVDGIVAEARSAARGSCALLDITAARDGSMVKLHVAGVVGGAGERERLDAALRQVRSVGQIIDDALLVPEGLCPTLRTLAAIPPAKEGGDLLIVGGVGSDRALLADKGALSLRIVQSGERHAFVYIDAFSADGTVTHLLPSLARTNNLLLQEQQVTIDGRVAFSRVHRPAVVSVIAAQKLLPAASNPTEESGDQYAAALKSEIEELAGEGGHVRVIGAWRTLQMETK